MVLLGLGVRVFICRPPVGIFILHHLGLCRCFLLSALILHPIRGTRKKGVGGLDVSNMLCGSRYVLKGRPLSLSPPSEQILSWKRIKAKTISTLATAVSHRPSMDCFVNCAAATVQRQPSTTAAHRGSRSEFYSSSEQWWDGSLYDCIVIVCRVVEINVVLIFFFFSHCDFSSVAVCSERERGSTSKNVTHATLSPNPSQIHARRRW